MSARPYRWIVESLLFLLYMVFGISWLAWSPLLPDVENVFDVSHARAGLLISAVSVAKAFVPILAGVLAARLGNRRAIALGAVLAALAVAAPYAPSFEALLGVRFLFGIGGAIIVTLTGAAAMEWFPRGELPMVNGLNNVAVNCGITIAMFVAVPLAGSLGWQKALALIGASGGLVALAWLFLGREGAVAETRQVESSARLGEVLRMRETWLVALAFTGPLSLYLALNTWLPTHYMTAFRLSKGDAAHATGVFNLVGIPTALIGGWLCQRLGLRRPLIIIAGLLMPVAAAGMVALPSAGLRTAASILTGIAFFLYVAPLFTVPMELEGMTPRRVALMTGVVYSVAYLVSFVSPLLVGFINDRTGSFLPGLLLAAAGAGSLALAGFLLPETGPAGRSAPASPARLAAA
jgi:cyanate permease